jgi:Protein of unknown function (DUF3631)
MSHPNVIGKRQQQDLFERWVRLWLRRESSPAARAELTAVVRSYLDAGGDLARIELARALIDHVDDRGEVVRAARTTQRRNGSSRSRKTRRQKGSQSSLPQQIVSFVSRYVAMPAAQKLIVALWTIHTHCVEAFEQTPYLAVTSPERQCGKSRLLESLDLLVARPWMAVLPSEAVVYRNVDRIEPTLLLDEVDAIFNPKTADRYEGLRALLNAGHRRGAKIPRCIGAQQSIVEFSAFCPKVIAGIGTLPDTVADRSLPIRLERRKSGEPVARFIRREVEPGATELRDRIEAWAETNAESLRKARPKMPERLSDRMQEGCECLVAIADAMGCGPEARSALVDVLSCERVDDVETMRLRLLRDLRTVWEDRERERKKKRIRGIPTATLLAKLWALEESPWGSYYGHQLEANDLASLLSHFRIRSTTIRPGDGGNPAKGYKRDALHEAWERYLP